METRKVEAIREARRRAEEQRLDAVHQRIASGEIASVSNDTKWEKIFNELQPIVRWDTPVSVKLIDSDVILDRPGLFQAYVDRGHVEHPEGLLLLVFVEWVRFSVVEKPHFPFQVDCDFDGSNLQVFGYRRMSR